MNYSELTADGIRQHRPDLMTAIEGDITARIEAARAEGAKAEGARIAGIHANARLAPGHDALVAEMVGDGKTTPDQAASRLLAAAAAVSGKTLQALKDADKTVQVAAAPTATVAAPAGDAPKFEQTEEGWKAEYAASPALRSEFASAADYVAIRKAETSGRVRVLGAKSAA